MKNLDAFRDPSDSIAILEHAFFEQLRASGEASQEGLIRERLAELAQETAHLVHNPMDEANVRFALLAVAASEYVCESVVRDCLLNPLRSWVLEGTRAMLDLAADPFAALVSESKAREASFFGPSFEFERPIDDAFGYVLEVRRCMFHETLRACGRTDLQPILCDADLNWIDAIDPERHHLRFTRPSTFASADVCRMWFSRIEHLDGRVHLPVLHGAE
jgi:hypothetical protein